MIRIFKHGDCLSLKIELSGKTIRKDIRLIQNAPVEGWLLAQCRPVFDTMPHDNMPIECSANVKNHAGYVAEILYTTNMSIREHKGTVLSGNNILFWNVADDIRYKSLYDRMNKRYALVYKNLELGFDRKTRQWTRCDPDMDVGRLVDYLAKNDIGKIVTVNNYVSEKYQTHYKINLIRFLEKLGLHWVTIWNDPIDFCENGFYKRKFFESKTTFSNLACLDYKSENVKYGVIPQDYKSEEPKPLKDYDIVVMSNTRWDSVERMKPIIEMVLSTLSEPITEINLWYLALRHLLLNVFCIDEFLKYKQNAMLHMFYFSCVQYLKFQALNWLDTDRKIRVFGDVGWKNVTNHYEGSLDNKQINKMYNEGGHLYMLLNCSFSYLDASGPVYDVVRRRVPWINFSPTVKTKSFSGLEQVEYTTKEKLNELVNDYKVLSHDLLAHKWLESVYDSSVKSMESNILNCKREKNLFEKSLKEHKKILDRMIEKYLSEHEDELRFTYQRLFYASGKT